MHNPVLMVAEAKDADNRDPPSVCEWTLLGLDFRTLYFFSIKLYCIPCLVLLSPIFSFIKYLFFLLPQKEERVTLRVFCRHPPSLSPCCSIASNQGNSSSSFIRKVWFTEVLYGQIELQALQILFGVVLNQMCSRCLHESHRRSSWLNLC